MLTPRRQLKYWLFTRVPGFAGRYPYYGTRVHFSKGAAVVRTLCTDGTFEPEIVSWLTRLARRDSTVFDVGANIGLMAIPVLRACPTARVVSFEPSPTSLPFLQRTAAGSPYADRWTIVAKGLAQEAGDLDFCVGRPGDAMFEGFKGSPRIRDGRTVRVPVSTLDDEWRALGRPDVSVIKIDVEGAEALVLAGAEDLVTSRQPAILLEWHATYLKRFGSPVTKLVAFARDFGYRLYTIPAGVPVDDERTLHVQMMVCSNFLLLAHDPEPL